MTRLWLTNGTPTLPGILNPLTAACDEGYVPERVRLLTNPGVEEPVARACDRAEAVLEAYGVADPDVGTHDIAAETDFADIVAFYRSRIEAATERGDPVAVDVTPGRKFMSAIGFQAGVRYGADRVLYFHRRGGAYDGRLYPEIPRTAADLIDFTEVL